MRGLARTFARFLPAAGAFGAVAITSGALEIAAGAIGIVAAAWAAWAGYYNWRQERAEARLAERQLADYEQDHPA